MRREDLQAQPRVEYLFFFFSFSFAFSATKHNIDFGKQMDALQREIVKEKNFDLKILALKVELTPPFLSDKNNNNNKNL